MSFTLNLPVNSVSFGQVSTLLLRELYKKNLNDFFNDNKKELLNKEEIISMSNSMYSLYPYGTYNKNNVKLIAEKEEILFGFKCGLLFGGRF